MSLPAELAAALCLLTRLPVSRFLLDREPVPLGRTLWAFPLAGAFVGGVGGAAYAGCVLAGFPPSVGAVWTLAAMMLVTGALHEDGLADMADGFGGGRSRERKLEIMRESRIGSFGAIALILALGTRGAAISALAQPLRVLLALLATGALSRAAMIVPLLVLGPARSDGLAAELHPLPLRRALAALALAMLIAGVLLPVGGAMRASIGALVAALVISRLARVQIGGYTGDVLGAVSVMAEAVAISAIAGVGFY